MAENEVEDANQIATMIAMGGPNEIDMWCRKNDIDREQIRTVVQRYAQARSARRNLAGLMMHGVALGYELARLRYERTE